MPGLGGVVLGALSAGLIKTVSYKDKKITRVPVFYSFHFGNDVMRVQQVRNIGSIEGNEPTSPNNWEQLKRTGENAVKEWIDDNMKYKRCVVVLIGSETADRYWVQHEISKVWNDGRAIIGIYINNLKCPRNGKSRKGKNPFKGIKFEDGTSIAPYIPCYEPPVDNAYGEVAENIQDWIAHAIKNKAN